MKILHLANSNWDAGISVDSIVGWLQSAGYKMERLVYADWYGEFVSRLGRLSRADSKRSVASIADWFAEPMGYAMMPKLDTTHFRSVLATIGIDGVPCLDEAYVHHFAQGILS